MLALGSVAVPFANALKWRRVHGTVDVKGFTTCSERASTSVEGRLLLRLLQQQETVMRRGKQNHTAPHARGIVEGEKLAQTQTNITALLSV